MIRSEPWTGVGAGQYAWIFPQYREATRVSAETPILHPESDWLLVLVEHGWAAALALVLLVGMAFTKGGAAILGSNGRSLRAGCLVAAGILALHGLFDVPGHRVGLAWAAMWLAAACLPSHPAKEKTPVAPSRFSRALWRVAGLGLAGVGSMLLFHGVKGSAWLPSEFKASHLRNAEAYFNEDRAAAKVAEATGATYRPHADQDPLKKALAELDRGLALSPLDPHLHHSRGLISLHYKSGGDAARRSFEIQCELEPLRVGMVLEQAWSWSARDVLETESRWKLALERARQDEKRDPLTQAGPKKIFEKIVQMSGTQAKLLEISREMARGQADFLVIWLRTAPKDALDSIVLSMPDGSLSKADRKRVLEEWSARGRGIAAEAFERNHSDLFKEN
ncbi:MAG: hypothetical protein EOP84_05360 [Verrucomicrobiaceae bacterium]|nr:MAG: hypothetical protein EOP84_05360 [Verrucomicrobiaceae bacterium]